MIVVIGFGAAGMTATIHAAQAGAEVVALESSHRPGAKIRISGGGRCNVLPSSVAATDFHTRGSSNVVRRLLRTWSLPDVHRWFETDLGVPLKTEATGKVFPVSDDASEVVRALTSHASRSGAQIRTGWRVTSLDRVDDGRWRISAIVSDDHAVAGRTEELLADRVILTTGGLSLPKTGSDGSGFRMATALGHDLEAMYPALVPLTLSDPALTGLSGLSLPASITAHGEGTAWAGTGDLLLTHRGVSGPVALDASHQVTAPWARGTRLTVSFGSLTADEWTSVLAAGGRRQVVRAVAEHVPARLAPALVTSCDLPEGRTLAELRRDERTRLLRVLTEYPLAITGDGGYRQAEVTGGGVPLHLVDPKTLGSRVVPGLHFAGEILDVTGRLGGYNFHWAWITGRLAGESAAKHG